MRAVRYGAVRIDACDAYCYWYDAVLIYYDACECVPVLMQYECDARD
jgi:hypothetical protein